MIEKPSATWWVMQGVLLVLVAPVPLFAQQATVRAVVSIEAPTFRDNIGHAIEDVEEALSEKLVDLGTIYFPFLRWEGAGSDTAEQIAPTLRVVLAERSGGFLPEFLMVYLFKFHGAPADTIRSLTRKLYKTTDDPPTHSARRLHEDLQEAIVEELDNDDFRTRLHEEFLRHVPLATEVVANREDRRVIVPLPFDSMRLNEGSILRVKFIASFPAKSEGTLRLSSDGRMYGQGMDGLVRCVVDSFKYPPDRVAGWHDRIPVVLEHKETLTVFMDLYERDTSPGARPQEDGFVVTDPN